MARLAALVAALFILMPSLARAADLRVTDTTGTRVVVRNASLDYDAGIAAVRESNGIRVQQGDATVTVKWSDLESVTVLYPGDTGVLHPGDAGKDDRLEVELALRSGRRITASLTRVRDTRLRGRTELGDYTIDLEKVRAIEPLRQGR